MNREYYLVRNNQYYQGNKQWNNNKGQARLYAKNIAARLCRQYDCEMVKISYNPADIDILINSIAKRVF